MQINNILSSNVAKLPRERGELFNYNT